jgi:hypothetical protein
VRALPRTKGGSVGLLKQHARLVAVAVVLCIAIGAQVVVASAATSGSPGTQVPLLKKIDPALGDGGSAAGAPATGGAKAAAPGEMTDAAPSCDAKKFASNLPPLDPSALKIVNDPKNQDKLIDMVVGPKHTLIVTGVRSANTPEKVQP